MAILKEIPTGKGVNADYWMVGQVNLSMLEGGNGRIVLLGYPDREAAKTGKEPLSSKAFPLKGEEYKTFLSKSLQSEDSLGGAVKKAAYDFVMSRTGEGQIASDFAGGERI